MEQFRQRGNVPQRGVFHTPRLCNGRKDRTVLTVRCTSAGGHRIAGSVRVLAPYPQHPPYRSRANDGRDCAAGEGLGGAAGKVRDLTDGGVDYSFEAIDLKTTAEQCYQMLRDGGTATIIIGMIPEGTKNEIDAGSFLRRERKIQGSSMGSNRFRTDMPRYIEFYRQGWLKLDELVSQHMKVEQLNEASADMKAGNVARSVIMFD